MLEEIKEGTEERILGKATRQQGIEATRGEVRMPGLKSTNCES